MPIYEFRCSECGARFERWQRFDDPEPATCPNGHTDVHRLLSQPAIIFKGSGFYVTDHGRNGSGRSARKPKEDASTPTTEPRKAETEPS